MGGSISLEPDEDGEIFSSLVVSIPYSTDLTRFQIQIQADTNSGATVRGSTDGDNTLGSTYLQVEEYH
jgi:hypothetical protein